MVHLIGQGTVLRHGEIWVNSKKGLGFLLGHFQRAGILHQVRHPQRGQAVMGRAAEITGAAVLKIIFCHSKTV